MLGSLSIQRAVAETAIERQIDTSMGLDSRKRVCGGVLEGGEGFVLPQALRKVPGGLGIEVVARQAASASRMEASASC